MSTRTFAMPDVGEGLTEAEIVAWRVEPGQTVAINDVIVEVETAKAAVELPSPYAGVVERLHHPVGAVVPVGEVIISIGDGAADGPAPADGPAVERTEVLVGYGPSHQLAARRPRRAAPPPPPDGPVATAPRATPPVRKLAKDLGVDLDAVVGTGAGGAVTRGDVVAGATATRTSAGPDERIPVTGVRRLTADAMVRSAFTAPHVTEWVTVDVTRSLRLLERLRSTTEFRDRRLTPLVLVMRATLLALRRHPGINASWDEQAREIVRHGEVHLGIAAATPRGLIVPNIRSAQSLSFTGLADALDELVATARAGRTTPAAMSGGTFTITNVGVFGVDGATPILNPGEAGILAVGTIARRPWEHKGRIALRDVATLSLSFDHRLVDGELGSRVLADIAAVLERPALALAR